LFLTPQAMVTWGELIKLHLEKFRLNPIKAIPLVGCLG
jgi:hypothetical protein